MFRKGTGVSYPNERQRPPYGPQQPVFPENRRPYVRTEIRTISWGGVGKLALAICAGIVMAAAVLSLIVYLYARFEVHKIKDDFTDDGITSSAINPRFPAERPILYSLTSHRR